MKIQFIMKKPFCPSALLLAAKLFALAGMIALPHVVLTSMRSEAPSAPLAGATFVISNSTGCDYTAVITHSGNCPATSFTNQTSLSVPQFTNNCTVTVTGTIINKVELKLGATIFATWTCSSGTSGSWAANADVCEHLPGFPNYFARAQGNGYGSNKIEWQL